MVFTTTTVNLIALCVALALFGACYLLLKTKFNLKVRFVAGLIAGFFAAVAVKSMTTRILVINQDYTIEHLDVFGSVNYELDNEKSAGGEVKTSNTGVINNTTDTLVVESFVYGEANYYDPGTTVLPPYSFTDMFLGGGSFDYYFEDEPPEKKLLRSNETAIVFWLHRP